MPLNVVFLRPQNWSRLNPITKARFPPSRHLFGKIPLEFPQKPFLEVLRPSPRMIRRFPTSDATIPIGSRDRQPEMLENKHLSGKQKDGNAIKTSPKDPSILKIAWSPNL